MDDDDYEDMNSGSIICRELCSADIGTHQAIKCIEHDEPEKQNISYENSMGTSPACKLTRNQRKRRAREMTTAENDGKIEAPGRNGGNCCVLLNSTAGSLDSVSSSGWSTFPQPMVVDSGAAETVMPEEWLQEHMVKPTEKSRNDVYYTAANGEKLYNKGERLLNMTAWDGSAECQMKFQVVDKVTKALASVAKMVDAGNRVVFDMDQNGNDLSHIYNKSTGERVYMRRREGVYVLDMWVAPPAPNNRQGFGRQGM